MNDKTQPPAIKNEAQKSRRSRGERAFDWGVYGGIAGVVTFIAGIPIAYWAKYGRGANLFKRSAKWLQNLGMKEKSAEDALMVTALMQGGNLTLIPVKIAENYKPEIVEKFNKALGEKSDKEAVREEPKQTWGSLIKARVFLAWLPVYLSFRGAATVFPNSFEVFERKFAEYAIKPFGKRTHIAGKETLAFRLGKIAALDLFATAAAATLLYIGSRIFARLGQKEDKEASPENAPAPLNSVATETASEPKRFSKGIVARKNDSYAENVASQKAQAMEKHLTLNA